MKIFASCTIILTAIYCCTILLFLIGMLIRRRGVYAGRDVVSVIIAARNEEEKIASLLSDLVAQTYPPDRYEIIIANDHSTDATANIVGEFSSKHPFIHLLNVTSAPSHFTPKKWAIQSAIAQAKGEIILVTDADCRVGPQWIESMLAYFEPDVGFVIGFSQFGARGHQQNLIERYQAFDFMTLMGAAAGSANLGFPLAASGQNLGYRKSAFKAVGGYLRVAHRVSGDDVLLLQLIRKFTRFKIVFAADPHSYAISDPQPSLATFINQRKRWASNGSVQLGLNFFFFIYLMQVLLYNAALLIGILLAVLFRQQIAILLICLLCRVVIEFAIALRSAIYFRRTDLLKYFPIWFIAQIPYIIGVGLTGTFGTFQWKDRVHSAQVGKAPA